MEGTMRYHIIRELFPQAVIQQWFYDQEHRHDTLTKNLK